MSSVGPRYPLRSAGEEGLQSKEACKRKPQYLTLGELRGIS